MLRIRMICKLICLWFVVQFFFFCFPVSCSFQISVLDQANEESKYLEAVQAASKIFPLPVVVWEKLADKQLSKVKTLLQEGTLSVDLVGQAVSLMRQACEDCGGSVMLWNRYLEVLEFALALDESLSFSVVRETFERALRHSGYNCEKGADLWQNYARWEDDLLMEMSDGVKASQQQLSEQMERVRRVYSRMLSAPLKQGEQLWQEYTEWEIEEQKVSGLQKKRDVGKKAYDARKEKESTIVLLEDGKDHSQDVDLFNAVSEYLTFEESQLSSKKEKGKRDTNFGKALFERALLVFHSTADLWLRYVSFAQKWFAEEEMVEVAQRGQRFCKWSGMLQAQCARVLYLHKPQTREQVEERLVQLLNSSMGLDDYDHVYKALEELFPTKDYAAAHVKALSSSYFKERPDLLASHYHYLALCALKQNNAEAFFQNSESAIKAFGNTTWEAWSRFISRAPLDTDDNVRKVRTLYKRALNLVADYPESLYDAYQKFERVYGDAATLLECHCAIERRGRVVMAMRLQWQKKQQQQQPTTAAPTRKEQVEAQTEENMNDAKERTLFVKNLTFELTEDKLREDFGVFGHVKDVRLAKDGEGKSKGFAFIEYETKQQRDEALLMDGKEVMGRKVIVRPSQSGLGESGVSPVTTLFISNLPFDCDNKDINNAFDQSGMILSNPIKAIRILKSSSRDDGKHKGCAFLDFTHNVELDILKLSGVLKVKGRPMTIEIAKTKSKEKKDHHDRKDDGHEDERGGGEEPIRKKVKMDLEEQEAEQEKEKETKKATDSYDDSMVVFVGQIPSGCTQDDVQEALEQAGQVQEVRMVKNRDDSHRGKAFVTFARKEDREKAIAQSGKIEVKGQRLIVSEPKPRNKGESLKGKGFVAQPIESKPVTSLVPAALQKRRKIGTAKPKSKDDKPLTQADFKKMFK